ncbi:MAG: BMP family lipoprotein [Culicoidibacterales bacterium]
MKKLLALTSLALVFTLGLTACGSTTDSGSTTDLPVASVGLVTDTGGINDKSFNQGSWEGVEEFVAANEGVKSGYLETQQDSDIIPNLDTSAAAYNVVVAPGFKFAEGIATSAKQNTGTKYILLDATPTEADEEISLENVISILFREEQAGYLAGIVAAESTKSDTLGFIGGIPMPAVMNFAAGYIQGAKSVNPDIKVDVQYANSFSDTTIGKQKASAMYASGIDIIFVAAGGVGTGVIEQAKELTTAGQEAWVIGVDRDQYADGEYGDGKSVILTSAVKHVGVAVNETLEAIKADTATFGQVQTLGITEDAVGLPAENPNITDQAILDLIVSETEKMKAGEIKVENSTEFAVQDAKIY